MPMVIPDKEEVYSMNKSDESFAIYLPYYVM